MEGKSRRRFARPFLRSRVSPPSPRRKWSGTPKKRPSAMTVPVCFSSRLASFATFTVLWGNITVPAGGTSPRRAGISWSASTAILRFTARMRFALRTKNSHRPRAHIAIVCDRTDPPPVEIESPSVVAIARDLEHVRTDPPRDVAERGVDRAVHEHPIPGTDQVCVDQEVRLRGPGGHEDPVRARSVPFRD